MTAHFNGKREHTGCAAFNKTAVERVSIPDICPMTRIANDEAAEQTSEFPAGGGGEGKEEKRESESWWWQFFLFLLLLPPQRGSGGEPPQPSLRSTPFLQGAEADVPVKRPRSRRAYWARLRR